MLLTLARWASPAVAAALLALIVPASSHAQLGGLVKKTKEKVAPTPASPRTAAADTAGTACGLSCMEQHLAITPDLVDRLVKGLKAELAERDRLEQLHANDGIGRLYAARDFVTRCDSLKRADSIYQAQLATRAYSGTDMKARTDAMQEITQLPARLQDKAHQLCESKSAPPHDGSFEAMLRSVQAHQDSVGAQAAGMTPVEFAAALERVAGYVLAPGRNRLNSHEYPPSAIDAMDARLADLAPLIKREFNINGTHKTANQIL